jgi:hypothetical protein
MFVSVQWALMTRSHMLDIFTNDSSIVVGIVDSFHTQFLQSDQTGGTGFGKENVSTHVSSNDNDIYTGQFVM